MVLIMVLNSQITLIKVFIFNNLKRKYGGARSPASLIISSVWKPYMKHNCKLDDLRAGFEVAEGNMFGMAGWLSPPSTSGK